LRIWSDEGEEVYPSPHPNSVKCISINADKSRLLTGSYGGTVAMFDLKEKRWTKFERPTMSGISSITWDNNGQFLASSYDGHIYPIHA
jgi:WD40 repeat protein